MLWMSCNDHNNRVSSCGVCNFVAKNDFCTISRILHSTPKDMQRVHYHTPCDFIDEHVKLVTSIFIGMSSAKT